ncbi:MAG TPA: metallophosphoesterase [Steroidobacteraceae bacterium]|nr:metallophosphoesterase [Steroidobacteraceae bacterium]
MHTVLQVSDPHFGTEQPHVVTALEALARSQTPDIVLLSGDITQRARRAQFVAARQFVDRLGHTHLLAIPGNHDIALFNVFSRALHPYRLFSKYFGNDLEPSFESETALILCVNTTRRHRHKHGEVSAEQIDRVAQRLQRTSPNQVRLVVTHQPVHVIRSKDEVNRVRGYDAAVQAWSRAGADIILGGHIHLPHVAPLKEIMKLPRQVWSVQAGTAVSHRVRGIVPNSVNILRLAPRHCEMERWDYQSGSNQFERIEAQTLGLER